MDPTQVEFLRRAENATRNSNFMVRNMRLFSIVLNIITMDVFRGLRCKSDTSVNEQQIDISTNYCNNSDFCLSQHRSTYGKLTGNQDQCRNYRYKRQRPKVSRSGGDVIRV